nr:glycoside hydrolase family 99-like domain-containing protein [Haloarchaeobius sp. HME9146]
MSGGHQDWTEWTVSDPVLGEYSADDARVVDQHLKWCLEYGIDWLSVSWWGPESGSDTALNGTLVEMERFDDVQFSILYETVGRLEAYEYDLDRSAARERLQSDFEYLAERYFGRENYLHIDSQPVVYFYVSNNLSGDVEAAFADATANLDTDLYVLAGIPFGSAPATYPIIDVADAVTSYNPYSPRADIEAVFHDNYEQGNKVMNLGARVADIGFVPVVIPGFNDTGIPDNVREDNPILSSSPDRYERILEQVRPHLADSEAVLITSFNEWYEDTQIEPGDDFGTEYLELTADKLANATSAGFNTSGTTLRFAFNETIVPAETNPDSTDDRELAFMAGGLRFLDDGEVLTNFDIGDASNEPLLLKGVYGTASNDSYSWRWFGGPDAETVLFVEADISNADTAVLTGEPMRSDRIEAEVFVDGAKTDQLVFGKRDGRLDDYTFAV